MLVTVLQKGSGMLQGGCNDGGYRWCITNQQLRRVLVIVHGENGALLHRNRGLGGMKVKNFFLLVSYSSNHQHITIYNTFNLTAIILKRLLQCNIYIYYI